MSHELLDLIDSHYQDKIDDVRYQGDKKQDELRAALRIANKNNETLESRVKDVEWRNNEHFRAIEGLNEIVASLNESNARLVDEKATNERLIEKLIAEQGTATIPALLDGKDIAYWHQAAINWQGRAEGLIARNSVMGKKCYMHEQEIERLKKANEALQANDANEAHEALVAANQKLRDIQGGLNRKITEQCDQIAMLKRELELAQEANEKLQRALPAQTGAARPYQIHNGVVLAGNELAENNRDAH